MLIRGELDELREQAGLVYAKLARRLDTRGGEEVVLFEEWRTPADLWAWTGGRLNQPRLLPGTEELVENLEISHYEALDLDPSDLDLTAITSVSARFPPNLVQRRTQAPEVRPAETPALPNPADETRGNGGNGGKGEAGTA
ncbi:MAG TPA: hypothetical protein VFS32_00555 [Candidatus Limnocylindrales bacterium]|nr:hypothetical protein [Candidatus Limnocylindrales bacterium]